MRVAFLVTDYPTESGRTAGVFHRTLAEALVRSGAQVEVVAPVPRVPWPLARLNSRWSEYTRIPPRYVLGGVTVHRPRYWQVPRGNYLGVRHRSFARSLRRVLGRAPDVIHAHFGYPCGLAAAIAARRWQTPVVLTLHGSDVNVLPGVNRRTRWCFQQAVRRATFVSAVSEALADRTEALTGRRPVVLPIGIDLRRFRGLPEVAAARQAIGVTTAGPVVLFVGGLMAAKGVQVLLDALNSLPRRDVVGIFVGEGPLRSILSGRPGVRSVGQIPNEEVPLYLRAADVFVLPSFSEGMPTVLVEAGAAGTPTIGTAVGGTKEILGDERGLLIPAGSVADLVAALEQTLGDRIGALGRAGRLSEYVARAYDVDKNAATTLKIYESLAGATGTNPPPSLPF